MNDELTRAKRIRANVVQVLRGLANLLRCSVELGERVRPEDIVLPVAFTLLRLADALERDTEDAADFPRREGPG